MFNLNRDVDYSLVLLSYLSKQKKFSSLSTISKEANLPLRFLARISSLLVKKGIIVSREGKKGGYILKKKSLKISFYDFLKIFYHNLSFLPCTKKKCCCQEICTHKKSFQIKIEQKFLDQLKKIKVKDLLNN